MSASGADACGIRFSGDMIYGSGLRDGDANIRTVPPYTQFNIGMAREFLWPLDPKPMTVRFDVVNLFDTVYFIRNGPASAFSPRNTGRGAAISLAYRRSFRGLQQCGTIRWCEYSNAG